MARNDNTARRPDDGSDEFARSSSLGRAPEDRVVGGAREDLHNRLNGVMERQAANTSFAREAAAEAAPAADPHAAAAGHAEEGHGHAKPAGKKKPPVPTMSNETIADLIATGTTMRDFYRKWLKGEVIRADLARVFSDVLDTLGLDGLRQGSSFYADIFGMLTGIPDHPIHKIPANYTDLGGQILAFHPDDEDPSSYHHSVEGLMSQINEIDLQRHYSILGSPTKLTQALSSAKGRAKAKEQFDKLFGPDITDHAEFLRISEQILTRLGCHITPGSTAGSPIGEHIGIHDLRPVHANHSLHAFVTLVGQARQHITAARLAKIAEPGEDTKLEKDMNKFGNTLMEHVKGNADLAKQFLGNLDMNVFNKTYRLLLSENIMDTAISEEKDELIKQIYEMFNLSGHVNAQELNSFTDGLIGPAPYPPDPAASPAVVPPAVLPATDVPGGALGSRNAVATDNETRNKFDLIRRTIHLARVILLEDMGNIPGMAGVPARPAAAAILPPVPTANSRLSTLFPPKSEIIKYHEFGTQLGRAVRGKTGLNLERARSAFLRGWEEDECRNHFMSLIDLPTLTAAAAGSRQEKEALKAKIVELTGLNITKITRTLFNDRITAIRTALGTATVPHAAVSADVTAKQGALEAFLTTVGPQVAGQIETIYMDADINEKLGEALQNATDAATVTAILDKINVAFLHSHYPRVRQTEAAVMGAPGATPPVPAMNLTNQQLFKTQVAAFIGAPKGFMWTHAAVQALTGAPGGLLSKTAMAPVGHPGRVEMEDWINHVRSFSPAFITHLSTLP